MMKKIFIIVNVDWFFLSHRLPIALSALKNGFEVTLITKNTGLKKDIEKYGITFIDLPFERSKVNLIKELKTYKKLKAIYKERKPDIVHHVTLKPIILGSLAAKTNPNIAVVNAVSGLGIMFSKEGFYIKRILTIQVLKKAFRIKNPIRVIFQNKDDREIFLNNKFITLKQTILIKGSGIDLDKFHYSPPQNSSTLKVLIAARMLYSKGFDEFSKAAQIISDSREFKNVEFEMAGSLDLENPSGIPEDIIKTWQTDRNVKWLGHVTDMKSKIEEADIIVFPSYYGEGVPKFLIESCAIGRPIITTNQAGCRDCVDNNRNGFIVEPRDSLMLAEKLKILLNNPELRIQFGVQSRKKAELDFSINQVVDKTLTTYNSFLKSSLSV